ncbi:MAG: S8/S53 family peptidase [Bdellovibrio sp.]|nr:S8/S53 family peptidase [Bdellovibrio sp.]
MKLIRSMMIASVSLLGSAVLAKPVTAVIRLTENVPMAELARQVTDPQSSRYQRYFTPSEIRALSAPNDSQYALVLQQLKAEGLKITGESKTHLWVKVSAEKETFEKTFLTQLQETKQGRFQLMAAVQVPAYLGLIAGVTGLDNSHQRRAFHKFAPHDDSITTAPTKGVTPAQIKSIYGFDAIYASGVNGVGQHIAIATYNDVNINDINTYYKNISLTPTPIVDRVLFNGTPAVDEQSAIETSLDAEFSGMIAPGANIHVFTSAENSDAGETAMFTAILDDNRAKVVNYSWGDCEKNINAAHFAEMKPIFERAVAQGVNLMVASGDSGSASCADDQSVQADWPAANPNVVAVGGSALKITSANVVETAWAGCSYGGGCSGGGISTMWTLPDYQKGIGAAFTMRSYPDVAFNADNMTSGEPVWATNSGKAQWIVIGGTSMSAPQWSGFMTLVASARQAQGKPTLGFLNPIVYSMTSTQKATSFNDITSGSNGAYKAAAGWDAVTGWGSPKASALFNYLVNL